MTEAAEKAGSVHVVTTIQTHGQVVTYVNDTNTVSGRQVISVGGARVYAIVAGGTAYIDANQVALSALFQASATEAQQFANRWLSFPSSNAAYKQIAVTLTLSSLLQQVAPTRSVTNLGSSRVEGRSVIGIGGDLPSGIPGTLYISATGSPLPVEEVSHYSGAVTTTIFSDWGEPVSVVPPSGAVPGNEAGLS